MKFGVGQAIRRKEDVRLLTGRGRYVDDLRLEGQAEAYVLRSQVAHGRIARLDASAARTAPGVLAVYVWEDVKNRLTPMGNDFPLQQVDGSPVPDVKMPHLADGVVRYVGEPVAFVVAETREQARDAAELIEVDIDELPAVVSPAAARAEGAPTLHDLAPGNLIYTWRIGDREKTDAAFAKAAHVVRTEVVNQRIVVASMEPRAVKASYDAAAGRWDVWAGTQGVHALKNKLVKQLGAAPENVRVRTPDVGGGFGMKLQAHSEDALVALAAKDTGRPVNWTGDRSESFLSDTQGRDVRTVIEGAFDANGRILAIRARSTSNLGAYLATVGVAVHTVFSAPITGGMYDVPAIDHETQGVVTNTTPTSAYRGAGRPEVIHETERLMEAAAIQLGIDRAEIRRINLLKPSQLPYPTAGGFTFDSLDCEAVLDEALAAADYAGFPARRAAAEARGLRLGVGVAYYMERTGGAPLENSTLKVTCEGVVEAAVGTQSNGQGHETAWAQIIHEKLGVPLESIRLMDGDSDALPAGGGTGGSRSAIMASRVLLLASDDVIEKGMEGAAHRLEAAVADIEFSPEDGGRYRIKGTDRSVSVFEVAESEGEILGVGGVTDVKPTFPNGCHVAEVEIDPETGGSRIVRYTIVDDFGTIINPLIVEGQIAGGIMQGVGQIFGEQGVYDPETGQPLTGSFMDYQMPRAADTPDFKIALKEVPSLNNPLGVKGCGEAGAAGGICASSLAMLDALRSGGVEHLDSPYTPHKVWQALRSAG